MESGVGRAVRVFDDLAAANSELARTLAARARSAVRERGVFSWVLAGGSTPQGLYELLARRHRTDLPWAKTEVFFGDERCVGSDDPSSNFGAAWKTVLARVPIPRARVHRIRGELRPPSEAARRYARALGEIEGGSAQFDLVLLGVGPDGHTASLFPGSPALRERRRAVVAVARAGRPPYVPRVTLTLPALASSRELWFLVAGADKADAIDRIFRAGPPGDPRWPASLVRSQGIVRWFLDTAAAGRLSSNVAVER